MPTEDLVNIVHSGTLTIMAHTIALDILAERNIQINELPLQPNSFQINDCDNKATDNYLKNAWQGKVSLASAFWPSLLLLGLLNMVSLFIPKEFVAALLYFVFAQAPVLVFWWVSVWRSAFRVSSWLYSILARFIVFISIYSTISYLVFNK